MIGTTEPERAPSRAERPPLERAGVGRGRSRARAMVEGFLPAGFLAALTLAFRVPVLLNASAVNSDMAVVGLQAMHILRGEWSWYLWGAGYQSPVDALLAALVFAVTGPSALALAMVPVVGHLAFVGTVYSILNGKFNRWPAALLTLPVVLTPMAVNYTLIMVQRLACTLMFGVSIWLSDSACFSKTPHLRYALACYCAFISVYLDLYGLQWLPALLAFAFLCALDATRRPRIVWQRMAAATAGSIGGYLSFSALRGLQPGSAHQVGLALDFDRIVANFHLLWNECLPFALGYRVFFNNGLGGWDEWYVPVWFRSWQQFAAWVVVAAVAFATIAVLLRRIPWTVRRLGLFGAGVTASTIGAFLVSVMPVDAWSTRYIAPLIFVLPFTFAPAFYFFRRAKVVALAVAFYSICAGVGGWMSNGLGYRSDDGSPQLTPTGRAADERQLVNVLRARGIKAAAAHYWVSYRLTFLFEEDPIVIPANAGQDRYWAYRTEFDRARDVAYIVHPSAPWYSAQGLLNELRARNAKFEQLQVGQYTVLVEHR